MEWNLHVMQKLTADSGLLTDGWSQCQRSMHEQSHRTRRRAVQSPTWRRPQAAGRHHTTVTCWTELDWGWPCCLNVPTWRHLLATTSSRNKTLANAATYTVTHHSWQLASVSWDTFWTARVILTGSHSWCHLRVIISRTVTTQVSGDGPFIFLHWVDRHWARDLSHDTDSCICFLRCFDTDSWVTIWTFGL